jgi:uncharacterized protein YneF (UPF0154 family)
MSDTTVINLLTFFVGVAWAVGLFLGIWIGRRRV